MIRKVCVVLLVALIFCVFSIPAFAASSDAVHDLSTKNTDQFLVTITRPDGDESTFKQSYVICGITDQDDVTVKVLREKDGQLVDFPDADGDTSWTIGSSGILMKEVVFPKKGANKIRIVAYKNSDDSKLQVNDFTITVLEQSVKDKIKNGLMTINEMLENVFVKQQ